MVAQNERGYRRGVRLGDLAARRRARGLAAGWTAWAAMAGASGSAVAKTNMPNKVMSPGTFPARWAG